MDTDKNQTNKISDIRTSVVFLSISGFIGYLIVFSSLVLKFMNMNPEANPIVLENTGRIICYLQIAGIVSIVLFLVFGIKKIINLKLSNNPKIILSKGFSHSFMVIGIFCSLLVILLYFPFSTEHIPPESINIYKTVKLYSKIFVSYSYLWFIITYWLRKKGSIYSVAATTSFSVFSLIGTIFPFGIIILIVWLFFRKTELANLKKALGINQDDKNILT